MTIFSTKEEKRSACPHFILFYPTNLTMYPRQYRRRGSLTLTLQPKPVRSTTFSPSTATRKNVPAATKIGKEPEEGEEDTRPVYSIYEEAEAAQGKDRPRTVYVDKDNNPLRLRKHSEQRDRRV